ncbi:hypothetical protein OD350_00085 [Clostridium beijerinckii]|uniref:hypothetical protein n=1 Tax=Clostridium beijerinckii TaxID=1520 RepID=UPI001570828A|nr:hypothetical protein [Clostridium beijerinckii]NRT33267.1 hypothetical protein [Clostridium beijerinckii]NRT47307.1 hypothetical protein [Clostridium beijerinckii]NRZ18688.1 hypothetical protein [Clostridium beijerinckii]UYZ36086.1 hypothetical protein OD350_00085 [Clostridium beijerinckii]
MIKQILGLVISILKNKTYMTAAREVWSIVDENFRIIEKIEDTLRSKAEEFDKLLLAKFPELTKEDVIYFRQAVAGRVNVGKEAVLDNSVIMKELQESNAKLQAENASLKDQLSKFQSLAAATVNTDVQQTV